MGVRLVRALLYHLGSPEDFKKFLADQVRKWGAIVRIAGARID